MKEHSLGQLCVLQEVELDVDPRLEQSLPPYAGAGLVQVRDRDLVPPPQVLEQLPHEVQDV